MNLLLVIIIVLFANVANAGGNNTATSWSNHWSPPDSTEATNRYNTAVSDYVIKNQGTQGSSGSGGSGSPMNIGNQIYVNNSNNVTITQSNTGVSQNANSNGNGTFNSSNVVH